MAKRPYIIALEEHYQDPEVKQLGGGPGAGRDIVERLDDLGALRIREMDEAGIDLQVLSHSIPGLQAVDAEAGPPLARRTNDRLHEAVLRHPDRFSAFAVLPTSNPRAAADELERAVTKLGFKGAMVNGMTGGVFHDDKRFWPIWERAAQLDVPIYIHPALPHPAVIDAHPGLKIILGHMGEGLPFLLWRISHGLRTSMKEKTFRDIFCEHFWITTSGFFSDTALVCSMMEMGIDRILFSVDYPFAENPPGTEWLKTLPLGPEDTEKLLNGNARRLLKL